MALYNNKEESWIKLIIIVDLQHVDLQCTIFWSTKACKTEAARTKVTYWYMV